MGSKKMTYIHLNEFILECHAFYDIILSGTIRVTIHDVVPS